MNQALTNQLLPLWTFMFRVVFTGPIGGALAIALLIGALKNRKKLKGS